MFTHALPLTVLDVRPAAQDVVQVRLGASHGGRLPDWTPGAHITLDLPPGPRCYSLCGDRWDAYTYTVAVRRTADRAGGAAYVHDVLRAGHTVRAAAPVNSFPLVPAARHLFVAGGIGIAPLLPMIDQLWRTGAPWSLAYTGRTRPSMPFADQLAAHAPQVELFPADEDRLRVADVLADAEPGTAVYVCGPERLVSAVEQHQRGRGMSVRTERFSRTTSRVPALPFTVRLGEDGRSLHVPADRSLRDVLVEAGVDVAGACRQGLCGSCETPVVAGDVEHLDQVLEPDDARRRSVMFPCVSRARTPDLVLDL